MGTNTRAELLALWALLWFSNRLQVHSLHVFGDSMSIVDWAAGNCKLRSLPLHHWIVRTHRLIADFDQIFFKHIYRSFNTLADDLSKRVLLGDDGVLFAEEYLDNSFISSQQFQVF